MSSVAGTIKQPCPSCGVTITIKSSLIGKKIDCPKCKFRFLVETDEQLADEDLTTKKSATRDKAGKAAGPKAKKRGKAATEADDEDEAAQGSNKALFILAGVGVALVLVVGIVIVLLVLGGDSSRPPSGPLTQTSPSRSESAQPSETPEQQIDNLISRLENPAEAERAKTELGAKLEGDDSTLREMTFSKLKDRAIAGNDAALDVLRNAMASSKEEVKTKAEELVQLVSQERARSVAALRDDPANMLPQDTQVVLSVPVRKFIDSPLALAVLARGAFRLEDFDRRVGVEFKNVEHLVISCNKDHNRTLAVIRTLDPFVWDDVVKAMQIDTRNRQVVQGKEYFPGRCDLLNEFLKDRMKPVAALRDRAFVHKLDDRTLLIGDETTIKSWLTQRPEFQVSLTAPPADEGVPGGAPPAGPGETGIPNSGAPGAGGPPAGYPGAPGGLSGPAPGAGAPPGAGFGPPASAGAGAAPGAGAGAPPGGGPPAGYPGAPGGLSGPAPGAGTPPGAGFGPPASAGAGAAPGAGAGAPPGGGFGAPPGYPGAPGGFGMGPGMGQGGSQAPTPPPVLTEKRYLTLNSKIRRVINKAEEGKSSLVLYVEAASSTDKEPLVAAMYYFEQLAKNHQRQFEVVALALQMDENLILRVAGACRERRAAPEIQKDLISIFKRAAKEDLKNLLGFEFTVSGGEVAQTQPAAGQGWQFPGGGAGFGPGQPPGAGFGIGGPGGLGGPGAPGLPPGPGAGFGPGQPPGAGFGIGGPGGPGGPGAPGLPPGPGAGFGPGQPPGAGFGIGGPGGPGGPGAPGLPPGPGAGFGPGQPPGAGFGIGGPGAGQPGVGPGTEEQPKESSTITVVRDDEFIVVTAKILDKTDAFVESRITPQVLRMRAEMDMSNGQLRLGDLTSSMSLYLSRYQDLFPRGAFARKPDLVRGGRPWPASERVSFLRELLPFLGDDRYYELYDATKPDKSWRDPENARIGRVAVPHFLHPSSGNFFVKVRGLDHPMAVTHFVGMAGVGPDAPYYDRSDPRAGIFGYDRQAGKSDVTDGLSYTIMMIQNDPAIAGPWIAGGGSTVRGTSLTGDRDVGHRGGFISPDYKGKPGVWVIMADGSTRFLSKSVDPQAFKAMCTMAGGDSDAIGDLSAIAPEVRLPTTPRSSTGQPGPRPTPSAEPDKQPEEQQTPSSPAKKPPQPEEEEQTPAKRKPGP
jgi:hypothetical protein